MRTLQHLGIVEAGDLVAGIDLRVERLWPALPGALPDAAGAESAIPFETTNKNVETLATIALLPRPRTQHAVADIVECKDT